MQQATCQFTRLFDPALASMLHREKPEARRAMRAARNAGIDRVTRNDAARERRATLRAARERELSKRIGALGMLGSQHAGERAAAALHVERLRARLGKQWNELLRRSLSCVARFQKSCVQAFCRTGTFPIFVTPNRAQNPGAVFPPKGTVFRTNPAREPAR